MTKQYDVAAYFWPAYHDEPRWRRFMREGIGEWETIRKAFSKYEGHYQPRVPVWGYESESDPRVMEKKINAAASHGVNVFIFDWYWYDNQPFLENALNDGFLKAKNNSRMKFFIMWANHEASSLWDLERSHNYETVWPGAADRKTFDVVVDRWITRYFPHPSYYRINGCPVVSIYELGTLIKGLGGMEQAADALKSFRARVKKAGFPDLHLQAVLWGSIPESLSMVPGDRTQTQNNTVTQLGFDSLTNYQWCHYIKPKGEYNDWAEKAVAQWEPWSKEFSVPFYPHVSIGWDTNPRFKALQDSVVENATPEKFAVYLKKAKDHIDSHRLEPKLITVNSWNEWSEGSYLEPDEKFGFGHLEAVKKVFQI